MLEEGGNAVDACVAAAFAAWVAESPLTGPGAGGFALVAPADGRPPRVADFFVADAGARPAADRAARRCTRSTSASAATARRRRSSGSARPRAPCPARRPGLEAVHAAYGRLPWRELLAARDRARARAASSSRAQQAHLHAILDLILRHAAEGRRLYSRADGARLQPGDVLRLPDLGGTLERIADGRRRRRSTRGELAARDRRDRRARAAGR